MKSQIIFLFLFFMKTFFVCVCATAVNKQVPILGKV